MDPAMCDDTRTFGSDQNGDSGRGGSGSVTSSNAVRSGRDLNTSTRSSSITVPPRPVLMNVAFGGMEENNAPVNR